MKRRSFVKTSLVTTALGSVFPHIGMAAKNKSGSREFYELRVYTLKNEQQQSLVENYFKNAAIPALNRLGCKNIGVFTGLKPSGQTKLYVLIPYPSWDDYISVWDKLAGDAEYQQKGGAYLNAPATAPAYERIESSLLIAFTHSPKLHVPRKKEQDI